MLLTIDGMSFDHHKDTLAPICQYSLCRDLVNPVQVAIQGFDNAAKRV